MIPAAVEISATQYESTLMVFSLTKQLCHKAFTRQRPRHNRRSRSQSVFHRFELLESRRLLAAFNLATCSSTALVTVARPW